VRSAIIFNYVREFGSHLGFASIWRRAMEVIGADGGGIEGRKRG
jgi:hypothetical protein